MTNDRLAAQLAHHEHQSHWTEAIRQHVYRQVTVGTRRRALDVGCGGGWLVAELAGKVREEAIGCDVNPDLIAAAQARYPDRRFVASEPRHLPFDDASFDLVVCHFTLLWAEDPVALLAEMKRVLAPGGAVAALAEPDWGGYLEWPDLGLRALLCAALAAEGADPLAGRQLPEWFERAGLHATVGISGGPWLPDEGGLDAAWAHHRLTLAGFVDEKKLRRLEALDRRALREGRRLSHLPLCWAVHT